MTSQCQRDVTWFLESRSFSYLVKTIGVDHIIHRIMLSACLQAVRYATSCPIEGRCWGNPQCGDTKHSCKVPLNSEKKIPIRVPTGYLLLFRVTNHRRTTNGFCSRKTRPYLIMLFLIGSFVKKTLTWSKPYLRKLVFVHFHENACIFTENVHISLHFHENAQKCAHFERPLPVRIIFWFLRQAWLHVWSSRLPCRNLINI